MKKKKLIVQEDGLLDCFYKTTEGVRKTKDAIIITYNPNKKPKIYKAGKPSQVIKDESPEIRRMAKWNPIVWAALKVLDKNAKDMTKFLNKYRKENPEWANFTDALPDELFGGK